MIKTIISRYPKENSKYIYNLIEEDIKKHKKSILIVPEQYTLQSDIDLIDSISFNTVMDVKVLSFSSFKSFVIDRVGNPNRNFLSKNAKIIIITNILQEINDKLTIFSNKSGNIDFVNSIASLISSIKDNNFDDEFFKKIEESDDVITKLKFKEIKLIYDEYQKEVSETYLDNEDSLSYIIDVLESSDFLKDYNFYFDKFDLLSDLKLSLVNVLLKRGNLVTFSINLDKDYLYTNKYSDLEFFDSSIYLFNKLKKIDKVKEVFLDEENIQGDDIKHLIKNFEKFNPKKYLNKIKNIHFLESSSTKSEVENVAILINKLVKKDKFRYKDIGIYITDEKEYLNEITKIFNRYNLPIFIDKQRKLSDNHLIKTFLSIIRLSVYNFKVSDLVYLLRSGIFSLNDDFDDKAIILQNYIKRRKIKGSMFLEDKYFIFDEDFYENLYKNDPNKINKISNKKNEYRIVNELRDEVIKLVSPIIDLKNKKVKEIVTKIYSVMENINIKRGIKNYQIMLNNSGRNADYKENEQVWDKFTVILEELVAISGEKITNLSKIYSLIYSSCKDIDIGIIPPTKDNIIVCDFKRTRIENRAINFILGLNDVFFPSKSVSNPIIGKENIDTLRSMQIDLKIFDEDLEEREKLYLYKLITMSKSIYFSYSLSKKNNEAINRSIVLNGIMNIFSDKDGNVPITYGNNFDISLKKYSFEQIEFIALESIKNMIKNQKISDNEKEIAKAFIEYKKEKNEDNLIKKGLFYKNDKKNLDINLSRKLYSKNHFNVSEIEEYSKCPYKYFVRYGLKPNYEEKYDIDNLEVGTIVHRIFEELSSFLKNKDIENINNLEIKNVLKEEFKNVVKENLDENRKNDFRNKFILENVFYSTQRGTNKLISQLKDGDFKIYTTEEDFGYDENSKFPKVYVDEENYLRGRIDRIDKANSFVRIIDYKSGNKEFKIADLSYGLDLQLLIYMIAVENGDEKLIPLGSFYMPLKDEIESLKESYTIEKVEKENSNKFRMNGFIVENNDEIFKIFDRKSDDIKKSPIVDIKKSYLLSNNELKSLEDFVKKLISEDIKNIKNGFIKLAPLKYSSERDECGNCDFKGICKFDKTLDQLKFKNINKNIKLSDILNDSEEKDGI